MIYLLNGCCKNWRGRVLLLLVILSLSSNWFIFSITTYILDTSYVPGFVTYRILGWEQNKPDSCLMELTRPILCCYMSPQIFTKILKNRLALSKMQRQKPTRQPWQSSRPSEGTRCRHPNSTGECQVHKGNGWGVVHREGFFEEMRFQKHLEGKIKLDEWLEGMRPSRVRMTEGPMREDSNERELPRSQSI